MYTGEIKGNPYGFTDEQIAIGDLAYKIARKYEQFSLGDEVALGNFWREMLDHGFGSMYLPEAYGGSAQDMLTMAIAFERTSTGGFPAAKLVLSQAIFSTILLRNGAPEQQAYWLPKIASGELLFCFGLTEAQSGSNAPRMNTIARSKGDKWVINGEKTYISGVDEAGAILLAARTPECGDGITLFAIEDHNKKLDKQRVHLNGWNMYEKQFTLFLHNLEVGPESVIGEPGKGMRALFDGLNPERLMVAAQCVGLGRWGVAKAVGYASERKVFDDVIGRYQGVQHPLAEAYAKLEAAWALTVVACRQYDTGDQAGDEANLCKFVAADAGMFAIDACLQTHGGSGFTEETMIVDRYMILRLQKTAPVSREMALNHIARSVLGLPRSY